MHLLISEPERGTIANAIQSLKISSAKRSRRVRDVHRESPFWQKRCFDRNIWGHEEFLERLEYIHRNPVKRIPVKNPEDW